jgi:hypothetical protein
MSRVSRFWPIAAWVLFFALGSCSKSETPKREAITVVLSITERFPPQLVTGAQWVVRSLPGGAPIALRQIPPVEGTMSGFPYAAQVIDRDGDGLLEYEILFQGFLFSAGRTFTGFLLSSELTTAPFALQVKLLGAAGVLASEVFTVDVRGRPLRFGTQLGLRVEHTFDCGRGVPCIGEGNRPPVFCQVPGVLTVAPEKNVSLTVLATDPDGDPVTLLPPELSAFPVDSPPTWDPAAFTFSWTPRASAVREQPYVARFTARDSHGADAAALDLSIKVHNGNSTPIIRSLKDPSTNALLCGLLLVAEGAQAQVVVDAYDPDGEAVTLSMEATGFTTASGAPSFDAAAKRMTWTPSFGASQGGPYHVTFVARDLQNAEGRRGLELRVMGGNRPPVFEPVPEQTAVVGNELSFFVRASDPEGDSFQIAMDASELPAGSGAAFDPTTGKFTWTPRSEHVTPPNASPAAVLFQAMDARSAVARMRVPIRVVSTLGDGGLDGGAGCPYRCIPGEVCLEGWCQLVTTPCLTACDRLQLCLEGQCVDTQPSSCGTCPGSTVCVRGTCLADRDQDGLPDAFDFCPDQSGAPQTDTDGDRLGNACDAQPNNTNLAIKGGEPVSAQGRARLTGLKVTGTLGEWSMPAVQSSTSTRLRPGPAAMGGVTNR